MLTAIEKTELSECEEKIERGLKTFVDVGMALLTIRDKRLYRQSHITFEEYCRERWGFARRTAYQYIDAASVVNNVRNCAQIEPANESQARPLTSLAPDEQRAAWDIAIDMATEKGEDVTGKTVMMAVKSMRPDGERGIVYEREEGENGIVKCAVCRNLYDGSEIEYCPYCAYTSEQRQAYLRNKDVQSKKVHVSNNSGNNEWYTPPEYIEAARHVMGEIDLDPASSQAANKTVKAITHFTSDDDGLRYHWSGNVWMNPPYASELIGKFAWKLADHVVSGDVTQAIILVNNATETAWFCELIDVASAVIFPRGRIKFLDIDGNPVGAPLQGQAVIYCGDNPERFLDTFRAFGWGAKL